MKLNTTDFIRKGQFPLLLALGVMPLCTIIVIQIAPQFIMALPVLLSAYVLLAWLCMLMPGRIRAVCGAIGCACLMLLGLRMLPVIQSVLQVDDSTVAVSDGLFTLPVPILLCALLIYSLQFAAWPKDREIPFNWCASGIVIHLIGQFAVFIHKNLVPSPYDPLKPWLFVCFIAYMPLMLLAFNRMSMQSAAQNRQRAPLQMRRRNTVMTLVFFLLTLIIAAAPAIMRAIERIWTALLTGIFAIIRWLVNLLPIQSAPGGGGGPACSARWKPRNPV